MVLRAAITPVVLLLALHVVPALGAIYPICLVQVWWWREVAVHGLFCQLGCGQGCIIFKREDQECQKGQFQANSRRRG